MILGVGTRSGEALLALGGSVGGRSIGESTRLIGIDRKMRLMRIYPKTLATDGGQPLGRFVGD